MMNFYKKNLKKVFVGVFLTVVTATYAHAVDKNDFVKRLQSSSVMEVISLNFADVESVGNNIILHSSVLGYKEQELAKKIGEFALGDLVFENVTEDTDGNYLVERFKIYELKKDFEVYNFQINNFAVENFVLASEQSSDIRALNMTSNVSLDSFMVSIKNKPIFNLKNIKQNSVLKDKHVLDITTNIDSFAFFKNDASASESEIYKMIRPGKDSLDGSLSAHATWDINSGVANLDKMEFIFNDLGKINFNLVYGGFTADFLQAYEQINKDFLSMANVSAFQNLYNALMGELVVKYIALRFDNENVIQNILAHFVTQSGLTKEVLIEQIKSSLPLIALYVPNEQFVKNAIEQLSLFVENSESLTIATTKGRESKISQIVQAVSTYPTAFLDILGVTITANQ